MSSSDSGSTSVFTSIISGDSGGMGSWQIIIALLASSVGFVVAVVNSIAAYIRDKKHMEDIANQEKNFEKFKKELEDKQRRLVRFENVQELMKQYKKPLLQSAFDLQSRLANQVKSNFLHTFAHKGNERDKQYARLNMAYVVSEFLGWLEVIRQEIVFITGEDTLDLNLLIDAIKFQFTGETATQGRAPKDDDGDEHWQILQLYAGELRAIGEVMIVERTFETNSDMSVIGYAEFVRRANAPAPGDDAPPEEVAAWQASPQKLQQDTLKPLMDYIEQLMELPKAEAPTRRICILQVLLCKLIDLLDGAVPYDIGPEYELANDEEPRYVPRDFRLTPLVAWLSRPQLKWLSDQRFMCKVHSIDRLVYEDWHHRLLELPHEDYRIYTRLAFPGFREDLHRDNANATLTQREREGKLGKDGFPGAFPPRELRHREAWWWGSLSHADYQRWYQEAVMKGRIAPGGAPPRSVSLRRAGVPPAESSGGWWRNIVRQRKAHVEVKPEPSYDGYAARTVLTNPSVHQLRVGPSASATGANTPSDSRRAITPVQPINNTTRSAAGL